MEKHADAPSVEIPRTKDTDGPEQRKNAVLLFFFQSLVVAALFPTAVLGRSGGGDTLMADVVWRFSLLLCVYFYSAVCVLSAATGKARLFFQLTYPALLASVVDDALSHAAGCAIMYLSSVWIACMFGHALAERSASGKSTATAAAAAENTVPAQEAQQKLAVELPLIIFVVIVSSVVISACICVLDMPDYTLAFVVVLSAMLCLCLPVAIICALKPLRRGGVVLLGEECGTGNVLACWYLSACMVFTLSFIHLSEIGAVVMVWICVLGLAVFLGYCLRLHAYYVDIMRNKPEMVAPPADEVNKKHAAEGNKEQTETGVNSTKC